MYPLLPCTHFTVTRPLWLYCVYELLTSLSTNQLSIATIAAPMNIVYMYINWISFIGDKVGQKLEVAFLIKLQHCLFVKLPRTDPSRLLLLIMCRSLSGTVSHIGSMSYRRNSTSSVLWSRPFNCCTCMLKWWLDCLCRDVTCRQSHAYLSISPRSRSRQVWEFEGLPFCVWNLPLITKRHRTLRETTHALHGNRGLPQKK